MLKRLKLHNWRNCANVEIHFTPITVFIGANASGKTNIFDALCFVRDANEYGVMRAVQNRGGFEKIKSLDTEKDDPVEIEFTFKGDTADLTYALRTWLDVPSFPIPEVIERLTVNDHTTNLLLKGKMPFGFEKTVLAAYGNIPLEAEIFETYQYIIQRWQLFNENFMPPLALDTRTSGSPYLIEWCADNVPIMLDFMKVTAPALYTELQRDLAWLLDHIDTIDTEVDDHEIRFALRERTFAGREAPTVSAGSARLVAMLTAIHALNYESRIKMPGLIVIEEPDSALNPSVLRNLVEQFRYVVDGEYPRQIILTTHNPAFLDYFEPEEVRVVSRDERGYAHVNPIPPSITERWLATGQYSLGQVWETNAFGGLA
jgi:predicted ATPase